MAPPYTHEDFDRLSWHDCHVWGLQFRIGDIEAGDWTSDLVLDIDFITDWLGCGAGAARFRVAPATLTFHGVTDPRIAIDFGQSGHQVALHAVSIDRIDREPVAEQKVHLDRPYYRWLVRLNWPQGGELAFGAWGFTQELDAEPIVTESQHLSAVARARLKRLS
jgi:hypothetical protein